MNLVNDPWLPVLARDGTPRTVGLRGAFAEGEEIADLALDPCQRIAVTRLLVCIAQAALDGPADEKEWAACRPRLRDAALSYLDRWRHRFELFGDGAFLQADRLEERTNAVAEKLDLRAACGNNPTLFDHAATMPEEARPVPAPAELAMNLLVYQVYSPGGLIGQLEWDGALTTKSSELAPALEGSLLHTIIRGESLAATVHLNLLHKEMFGGRNAAAAWGRPTWELDRLRRQPLSENVRTFLGRLVPASRAIRCLPDSRHIALANGIACPKLPEGREPMATVITRRKGRAEQRAYVAFQPGRHPWRELAALLSLSSADRAGGALALANLRRLAGGHIDIWVGGQAADRTKILDMGVWTFSLPRSLLDSTALQAYQAGVAQAEKGEAKLTGAVKKYAKALHAGTDSPLKFARALYWTALDRDCHILAETASSAATRLADTWLPRVREAMFSAYERTCARATPRQIQAYAAGLHALHSGAATLSRDAPPARTAGAEEGT